MNIGNRLLWKIKLWFFDKKNLSYKMRGTIKHPRLWAFLMDFISPLVTAVIALAVAAILYVIFALAAIMVVYVLAMVFSLESSQTSNFIALIAALIPLITLIITHNRDSDECDEIQVSAKIIIEYLIELTRGNTKCKIYKDALSIILLVCPNKIITILHDIQVSIANKTSEEIEKDSFIYEQIVFLMDYLRNYAYLDGQPMESLNYPIMTELIKNSSSEKKY